MQKMKPSLLILVIILFTMNTIAFSQNIYYMAVSNKRASIAKMGMANQSLELIPLTQPYKDERGMRRLYRIGGVLSNEQQARIRRSPGVLYLEQARVAYPLFTPTDPAAQPGSGGQAAHLAKLEAYAAWDSAQGDTSVMIGILDTGVDILHPDLAGNLARNYTDPINGLDDDHNGFVDDYNGYDLANGDNNPRPDADAHGTEVASISSAVTNNALGVAGLGFKCRYLPVKVFGTRFAGYEGIIYAADRGCKVINLSWGGNGFPSQFEQDVIDYAVRIKGCVVVAAAGNTSGLLRFYPASYRGVISVGTSLLTDVRDASSTIAPEVDFLAPGTDVFGITSQGLYGNIGGGSSFSAPMVAALAGLARAKYPALSPSGIEALLKSGADWIDTLAPNRNAGGYAGRGRINFRKTLTGGLRPYPEVDSVQPDPLSAQLAPGVTSLTLSITNHLRMAARLRIRLRIWDTATTRGTQLVGPDSLVFTNVPADGRLRIMPMNGWSLRFVSQQAAPVQLAIELTADGHTYNQVVVVEAGFASQDLIGPFGRLTAGNNMRLGYIDNNDAFGAGFTRLGRRLLGEGGIIIAQDSNDVRDNVSGQTAKDNDFLGTQIRTVKADTMQVMEAQAFSPASAPGKLDLQVGFKGYAWPYRADRPGIITEFTLRNRANRPLDSLKIGLLADWDINRYYLNQMRWDSVGGFGYAYAYRDTAYTALVPLSLVMRQGLFAIDAVPSTVTGNVDVTDGFSGQEKGRTLMRNRLSAGGTGGTNCIGIHHTRFPRLDSGAANRVAYAWIAGASLAMLRTAANQSREAYRLLRMGKIWNFANQFSNCFGDSIYLDLPPGRWQFSDSSGTIIGVAYSQFAYFPTHPQTQLYVQQLDSLFQGPITELQINSRLLRNSLSIADSILQGHAVYLSLTDVLASDTVSIRVRNLSQTFSLDTTGNLDSLLLPSVGRYSICRSIHSIEGCRSEECDTVRVVARPVKINGGTEVPPLPYPNPASAIVNLPATNTTQHIYDAEGRLVWERAKSVATLLSVIHWPRGLYLWKSGSLSTVLILH